MANTAPGYNDALAESFWSSLEVANLLPTSKAEYTNRPPKPMTLAEFRATHAAGAFVRADLIGLGSIFLVMAQARSGDRIVLVRNSDRTPREFSEASTALRVVREAGFAQLGVNLERWELPQLRMGAR